VPPGRHRSGRSCPGGAPAASAARTRRRSDRQPRASGRDRHRSYPRPRAQRPAHRARSPSARAAGSRRRSPPPRSCRVACRADRRRPPRARPCACRRRLPLSSPSPSLLLAGQRLAWDRAVSGKRTQASIRSPASQTERGGRQVRPKALRQLCRGSSRHRSALSVAGRTAPAFSSSRRYTALPGGRLTAKRNGGRSARSDGSVHL
jgi:hypothetical protein